MKSIDGKVAVITGAASGMGEAAARLFVAEGARVVVADIQDDRGHALAEDLGQECRFVRCDVTVEADIAGAVQHAVSTWGQLDCMINNAGHPGARGPLDDITLDQFDSTVAMLLRAAFIGAQQAARVMRPRKQGSIISTTSMAGVQGGLGPHVYAAAKAGVIGLTRNLAAELGADNIRVNTIAPGAILTPMSSRWMGDVADIEGTRQALLGQTPLAGRVGLAEDFAHAALYLMSDASAFVSGHTLVLDGGQTTGSQPAANPHYFL